jgi:uncharacterized membrane protein YgaE (UPF0421/DUF939 family)
MTHEQMPDLTDEQIQELDAAMQQFVEYERQMALEELEREYAKDSTYRSEYVSALDRQFMDAFDHFTRLILK